MSKFNPKAVPSSRLSRIAKIGSLSASIAGNVFKNTVEAALNAEKISSKNTLLNINNAQSLAKHLAQMRGAAMKIGQMLSMDAGELLPPEWEPVLSILREQANTMPKTQLLETLNTNWGEDWAKHFDYFSFEPIAAASIGQVHRARLKTGEDLAIKIQYPGVSDAIESDIDNVAGLLKLTRLVPKGIDLDTILEQAKVQLKQEADYEQERAYLERYAELVKTDDRFVVPSVYAPLSNRCILCMQFVEGTPIDELKNESQALRDELTSQLIELVFKELFEFRFTQSDPNYANFLYRRETKQLVLLDFGACRELSQSASDGYIAMAEAMQAQDETGMHSALMDLGLINQDTPQTAVEIVLSACVTASESLQCEHYNFKQREVIKRLQAQTVGLMKQENAIASPNFDVALINRKVTGVVLLANKMSASIALRTLISPYIHS